MTTHRSEEKWNHHASTQKCLEETQHGLDTKRQEFQTQLAAEKAQSRLEGGGDAGTCTIMVKPLQFDGSISSTVVSLPI
jgi:hypothetical protein